MGFYTTIQLIKLRRELSVLWARQSLSGLVVDMKRTEVVLDEIYSELHKRKHGLV
jgi:hypothetical protein